MGDIRFTDRELDLMDVLWARGSATAAEMQENLEDDLAYTTVLTILQTLEEKGYLTAEKEGRAYRFFPEVGRDEAGGNAIRYLMEKVFRGSPEAMLHGLVDDADLSEQQLDRVRRMLEERLGDESGAGAEPSGGAKSPAREEGE